MVSALRKLGLKQGDHIGIYSKNCSHWILADIAIMIGGYVSVPYYSSLPGDQLAEVVGLSDVKAVFVGRLDHWTDDHVAALSDVITIKTPHYSGSTEITTGLEWDALIEEIEPTEENFVPNLDDLWTIKFTSGTTGTPKGVMLSQSSYANNAALAEQHEWVETYTIKHPKMLSFLPLNHVGERIGIELTAIWQGGSMTFNESVETFARDIQEVQPEIFFAVPRLWTNFYQGVISKIPEEQLDKLLADPATAKATKEQIRTSLGFRDLKVAATGAAITPAFIKKFFKKLDIHLMEAYGMTEVCGSVVSGVNPDAPSDSVGQAAPWTQVKIDPDSDEILFKSEVMMMGYYNEPEKTAEVLSEDGWLQSGDRGEVDESGFVRVIGRVKDAFKTAKGSYVTPNVLEEALSTNDYIEQVCVVGLGIPQPLAMINLSPLGQHANKTEVENAILYSVIELNKTRANYERISTAIIQTEQWSQENGILTPTLKIRRHSFDKGFGDSYLDWHESPDKVIWV